MDNYIITPNGSVYSKKAGRLLKPEVMKKGYHRYHVNGRRIMAHRLVAEKYIPNPLNKEQVNHIDGDKSNNCMENLEWTTCKENMRHSVENNLHTKGSNHAPAKLSDKDVIAMRIIRRNSHSTYKEIAEIFRVDDSTCYRAISGQNWSHL